TFPRGRAASGRAIQDRLRRATRGTLRFRAIRKWRGRRPRQADTSRRRSKRMETRRSPAARSRPQTAGRDTPSPQRHMPRTRSPGGARRRRNALAIERGGLVSNRDALIEQPQIGRAQQRVQVELTDENDLQQLLLVGLEVRQNSNLLENRQRQTLRLVDDQHG